MKQQEGSQITKRIIIDLTHLGLYPKDDGFIGIKYDEHRGKYCVLTSHVDRFSTLKKAVKFLINLFPETRSYLEVIK